MTGNTKLTDLDREVLRLMTLAPAEFSADHLSIVITQVRGDQPGTWDVYLSWSETPVGVYDAQGTGPNLAAALTNALAELDEQ